MGAGIDTFFEYGKLFSFLGEHRKLTRQELLSKGLNHNKIKDILEKALEEKYIIYEQDKKYSLNKFTIASMIRNICSELNVDVDLIAPDPNDEERTPTEEELFIKELISNGLTVQDLRDFMDRMTGTDTATPEESEGMGEPEGVEEAVLEEPDMSRTPLPASPVPFDFTEVREDIKGDIEEAVRTNSLHLVDGIMESMGGKMSDVTKAMSDKVDDAAMSLCESIREMIEQSSKGHVSVSSEEVEAYKKKIANLEKKVKASSGTLTKKDWKEVKELLYNKNMVEMPLGVVEAIDPKTGDKIKKKDELTAVPYFPGKDHVVNSNRAPVFSWADPITRSAVERDNIEKTGSVFDRMRALYKQTDNMKVSAQQKEDIMESQEMDLVKELLHREDLTDVQRIAEYSVIRHMSNEYYNLLLLAVNNGIKAENIIGFLEEKTDIFNMEVVRDYVSLALNDKNSDMRCEIARDLIDGKWSVSGEDGTEYRLYAKKEIDALKDMLEKAMTPAEGTTETDGEDDIQGKPVVLAPQEQTEAYDDNGEAQDAEVMDLEPEGMQEPEFIGEPEGIEEPEGMQEPEEPEFADSTDA